MKKLLILVLLTFFLQGCATAPFYKKVEFELEPSCEYQRDSSVDFNKYGTFSLIKLKEDASNINPLIEKQISFMLRNRLETLGYRYTTDYENADLVIVPRFSNEYKNIYVPPSSYTIPWRVPGQTLTTNYNFYGDVTAWGTATTKTPDKYVPMTFSSPGGNEGYFFPFIQILVYDAKTKSLVWSGTICNATRESDIRLSSQSLIGDLLLGKKQEPNFPLNSKNISQDDKGSGAFGFSAIPITVDGNNFYPLVDTVFSNSPADKQNLKLGDIIIEVDNQSTLNWTFNKILEALDKDANSPLLLTIKRGDKTFEVSLTAEDESAAKVNWKEKLYLDEKGTIKKSRVK